jgi:hypothetical protein
VPVRSAEESPLADAVEERMKEFFKDRGVIMALILLVAVLLFSYCLKHPTYGPAMRAWFERHWTDIPDAGY